MRIVAGTARGLPLTVPRGDVTRPTADRVREALFSSLGDQICGSRVLDLFAGSGALGLEAASRGAVEIIFVENHRRAIMALNQNRQAFSGGETGTQHLELLRVDAKRALHRLRAEGKQFNLVFADPPYGPAARDLLDNIDLPSLLVANGRLILETSRRETLPVPDPWSVVRDRTYGDTRVLILGLRTSN